jgi:Predicted exosome subunit
MEKLLELLSEDQINSLIEEIEERTIDSKFHMRLDKQELIRGNITISEKDTIKIKIHTPIYNKKILSNHLQRFFKLSTRLNKN